LQAPQTVENFVQLSEGLIEFKLPNQDKPVKKPIYDGLKFHRIVKKFVAQTGDPTGSSRGLGPGYTIPLELNGGLVHDRMGVVSMARSGDLSHGSQFFITLAPIPNLNGVNTIFGQVVDGANILNDFDKIQTNREDIPKRPVLIKKVEIERIYL
jgi:cyclophilin family peptidyl-prolyl cis-trans isomerase